MRGEGLEQGGKVEVRAFLLGGPAGHVDAVGDVEEGHAAGAGIDAGGAGLQGGNEGGHGFEPGEGEGRAEAAKDGASGEGMHYCVFLITVGKAIHG